MIGNNMDTKEYNDNIYTVRELNNGILAIEEKQVRMEDAKSNIRNVSYYHHNNPKHH